ncbi:MAG: hypothetical protein JNM89_15220 [Hyphomicrobiaceae bacterium]|nr:hypothetical protein [Hyphomicrobiaceae bacterium]
MQGDGAPIVQFDLAPVNISGQNANCVACAPLVVYLSILFCEIRIHFDGDLMFTPLAFRFLGGLFLRGLAIGSIALPFLNQPAIAQIYGGETADCRLDSEGRIIKRLPREPAERTSAQCAAACLQSSTNPADPNRCTGYNFTWTIHALQTGYVTPYADSPRACELLFGPLTFGKAWRVQYSTACILPCDGPPKPCGYFESIAPPPGFFQKPDPPTRFLDPASPSAKQPFQKPPR